MGRSLKAMVSVWIPQEPRGTVGEGKSTRLLIARARLCLLFVHEFSHGPRNFGKRGIKNIAKTEYRVQGWGAFSALEKRNVTPIESRRVSQLVLAPPLPCPQLAEHSAESRVVVVHSNAVRKLLIHVAVPKITAALARPDWQRGQRRRWMRFWIGSSFFRRLKHPCCPPDYRRCSCRSVAASTRRANASRSML
jgi:hypothetical protein